MSHANGLDREWPNGELLFGRDLDQLDLVKQSVLFKLAFNVGKRELSGVHRHLDLAQNPRQSTNVIFVAMGKNNRAHMLLVLNQVSDIGYHNVNAKQLRLRKHEAGVNYDNVVFPAQRKAVHAELAQATQGNNFQFFGLHLSPLMLTLYGFRDLSWPCIQ